MSAETETDTGGWRPLSGQAPAWGRKNDAPVEVSLFTRLARVHALNAAVDALIATALAGSLFFDIPTADARGKVALYLLLTMAPFAVVAPLLGPALDHAKGGRRWMMVGSAALRALTCAFMIGHVDSLLLFPEAFLVLVASKAYAVAKSALVPTVVSSDAELVRANSRLSVLAAVIAVVAGVPGAVLLKLGGPEWTLGLAVVVAGAGVVFGTQLPPTRVAPEPEAAVEEAELRSGGILLASSAMGLLRGMAGFITFLLAFALRGGGDDGPVPTGLAVGRAVRKAAGYEISSGAGGSPSWHFAVVLVATMAGGFVAALVAPRIRRMVGEEHILTGVLFLAVGGGVLAALRGGLAGAALIALVVGFAATAGKLAFDAIVQRDAPDANRGRSFARFETRFQLIWVVGAFVPVVVPIPARVGFLVVAGAAAFAAFSYLAGGRSAARLAR